MCVEGSGRQREREREWGKQHHVGIESSTPSQRKKGGETAPPQKRKGKAAGTNSSLHSLLPPILKKEKNDHSKFDSKNFQKYKKKNNLKKQVLKVPAGHIF